MKKIVLSLTFVTSLSLSLFAQEIQESTSVINGTAQQCLIANYAAPLEVVEGALLKKMADNKLGKPSKTKDGYRMYKGIQVNEIGNATLDYYFKLEDRKPNTGMYLLLSRGYDNFMKKETADSVLLTGAKNYLTKFMTDVTAFQLNLDIEKQKDVIKDIEKNLRNTVKQEESLTKEKGKIENKISGNEIEIQALKVDMEAQQAALEQVKKETATIEQMDALKKKVSKQENATKKATKKYESALEDAGSYKDALQKTESKLNDNATEQQKIKSELEAANKKLTEINNNLNNLPR
jgi:hypothetical protein